MPVTASGDAVAAYAATVPGERRAAFDAVLAVMRENLPPGYEETLNWGMVCWQVPLETFPDTYNGQPLMFCGLACPRRVGGRRCLKGPGPWRFTTLLTRNSGISQTVLVATRMSRSCLGVAG